MKLSIIIVHYKADTVFFQCLDSIKTSKPKTSFEVIVVDNDEKKVIDKEIKRSYPWVKYIKSPENRGFGAGNNLGAKKALGKYLFFLNPDTIVLPKAIDALVEFLERDSRIGIVAPLLLDKNKKNYPLQGTKVLTPLRAVFSLSLLNKLFPRNSVSKKYWLKGWNKAKKKEVDVVPGTAFMIEKKVFEKIGGFDEKFFLYFEEADFCKRVREKGYKAFILPKAKVVHFWGEGGTENLENRQSIFEKSRFYYFKKNYGLMKALLVESFLRLTVVRILFFLIILLGVFLRFDRLSALMTFFGDQAWFYLSARDLILNHNIPLVGITSSHTWLHQGPIWTYLLAVVLSISNFSPLSGAVLTSLIGVLGIYMSYKIGRDFFSKSFGLIFAALFASSPLVVVHSRMAYHTSPITFLVLILIYSLLKVVKGSPKFLVLTFLCMSLLYNFELATVVFCPVVLFTLLFGFLRKEKWFEKLKNKKILFYSFLALIIPMVPILIYDVFHGFPQTVKYAAWFGYKFLVFLHVLKAHGTSNSLSEVVIFFFQKNQLLFFGYNFYVSLAIFIVSILFTGWVSFKKILNPVGIIFLSTLIPLLGFFLSKTASEAYLPMLFPGLIFCFSFLLFSLFQKFKIFTVLLILIIVFSNGFFIYSNNYLVDKNPGYGVSIQKQINTIKLVSNESKGREFSVKVANNKFATAVYPYEYLAFYYNLPLNFKAPNKYLIYEYPSRIKILKLNASSKENIKIVQ